jgi:non-specific protein-tyrosine kinase
VNLDVRQGIRLGRRWWWLIALIVLIAAALGHGISSRSEPHYAATTTLVVRPVQSTGTLDYSALPNSENLVESYRQLVATWPVLDPVVSQLGLPYGWEQLRGKITVGAQPQSQLISITVSDPDPKRAAQLANAVANGFITYVGLTTAQISGPSQAALDDQLSTTQEQLDQVSQQIEALESGPTAGDPATVAQLASLRSSQGQLLQTLFQLQESSRQMDLSIAAAQTQVAVATPATEPTAPYTPRVLLTTLIAAVAGVMVATAVIAILEYRNDTIRPDTDLEALTGQPLLTTIARVPALSKDEPRLVLRDQPMSNVAEAIRLLRTKIAFAAESGHASAIAVCSAMAGEGKSTVTANLGVAMAEAGLVTVVIDANFHRPCQHDLFGIKNDRGLSTLLSHPQLTWRTTATEILPNLVLIPSGPPPPNPAALLSLNHLSHLLDTIRDVADVILIDSPPLMAVSDPLMIATRVDGVVLVCRTGRTRRRTLRQAASMLEQCGVQTLGLVLNGLTGRHSQPYQSYAAYARPGEAEGLTPRGAVSPSAPMRGAQVATSHGVLARYPDG